MAAEHAVELEKAREASQRKEEAEEAVRRQTKIGYLLPQVKDMGMTWDEFLVGWMTSNDQNQASRVLVSHGVDTVESMITRQPEVFGPWLQEKALQIYEEEGRRLSECLQPDRSKTPCRSTGVLLSQPNHGECYGGCDRRRRRLELPVEGFHA
ncbi:hypothetical protein BD410DRAFT_790964 [Rickenella mellea]|uniref:Uncharacterized protein n=1 Tax=Rickenella mellea TaxID=50990 RepID=A0A4Y7PYH9_9AGAM|nr:hypothetical protein BD410DRAFT_790964 [Rickenella mellea]